MNKRWHIGFLLLATCFFLASCAISGNVSQKSQTAVSTKLRTKDFSFKASRLTAQNGFSKTLITDYGFSVSGDSLTVRLPYYGRAYQVPTDLIGGGIDFSTTHFKYQFTESKKQTYRVEIIPEDPNIGVNKMSLTTSPSGYATVQVISTHRQPISFYGKIKE